jgi:hypothetical protein
MTLVFLGKTEHPTIIAFAFLHWGQTYDDYRSHLDYYQVKMQCQIAANEVFNSDAFDDDYEEKFVFGSDGIKKIMKSKIVHDG